MATQDRFLNDLYKINVFLEKSNFLLINFKRFLKNIIFLRITHNDAIPTNNISLFPVHLW